MTSVPPQIALEDAPCPLGCRSGERAVLVGCDRIHSLPGEYQVVRCLGCGLLRTNPRPTRETIGFYYPQEYGPFVGTRVDPGADVVPALPFWKRALLPAFRWNTEHLPALPPGRLLEIGCASGKFLHGMARQGWAVEGVEPSKTAAEAARALGYGVFAGPVEEMPGGEAVFDLVVGWMTLEHLHDPVRALRRLSQVAKPDGFLVLSVPNAGSLEFRLFRRYWYALQLPAHLFHFTPRTLGLVLAKGGWRIEKIFHQRVLSNLVASVGLVLRARGFPEEVAAGFLDFPAMGGKGHYLAYPLACLLSLLGQTGRMTVWARKAAGGGG